MKGLKPPNRGAQLLSEWRNGRGMTQMEFCQAFGHGVPTVVSHWEHSRRTPNLDLAVKLESFTEGAVPVESWSQPEAKKPVGSAADSGTKSRAA